jgi:predicted deacylase
VPTPPPTVTPRPTPTARVAVAPPAAAAQPSLIGRTREQRDIVAYALGRGSLGVAIVGGVHGAPEANSARLVWDLIRFYERHPDAIPPSVTLHFLPEANPDGLVDGTRELADGVDLNRNWPTADWAPYSYGPRGELDSGGGDAPMSEPETVTLANWILSFQPITVLSFHSAGGLVMGGANAAAAGLTDAFVDAAPGYVALDWIGYPVTGDFAQWCEDLGIPTVEVELLDHEDPDTERMLGGVQAVLDRIRLLTVVDTRY